MNMQNVQPTGSDQALIRVPSNPPGDGYQQARETSDLSAPASLRKHPVIALLIFLAVAGAGGLVIIRTATPVYFASSVIYVSPTLTGTLKDERQQLPQYNIQQHMLMIPRYDILMKTIQKLWTQGIDARLAGETEQRAAERLAKALEITHLPDSYQISVGLHSKSPSDMAEILNCLTDTFIATAKSEEFYGEDRRVDTLKTERGRLESELNQDLQTRSDIARQLGVVTFEQFPADKLVEAARNNRDEARRAKVEAEAEVTLLERDASLARSAVTISRADPLETAKTEHLEERRGEIEAQLARLRPLHPDYRTLSLELARIEEQLKNAPSPQTAESRTVDPASELLAKARIELERARKAEAEFNSELAADIAKVDGMTGEFQRGRDLGVRIEQLRNQISAIDDRLSYFRIDTDPDGLLRVISRARTPLIPEKNNRNKYLAALMGLSLAVSIGGVVLIDMTGSKILTPGAVKKLSVSRRSGSFWLGRPERNILRRSSFRGRLTTSNASSVSQQRG